jgi:hypothetical protein
MADSSVTVERVKVGYVFGGQLEVPDVQILLNPRLVDRFRNGDVAPLDLILVALNLQNHYPTPTNQRNSHYSLDWSLGE